MSNPDSPKTSNELLQNYETLRSEQIKLQIEIRDKYTAITELENEMTNLNAQASDARTALLGRVDDSFKEAV